MKTAFETIFVGTDRSYNRRFLQMCAPPRRAGRLHAGVGLGEGPGREPGRACSDGLPAVESACAEALIEGVSSADVIIKIVSRQRDPAPPITIMTLDALPLCHAPIADCARYDSLRRI